jgi:hypothetical protein
VLQALDQLEGGAPPQVEEMVPALAAE